MPRYLPRSLEELILCYNDISGSIPPVFPPQLKTLDISFNKFVGKIPEAICKSTLLKSIKISSCGMKGGIPETLPSSLEELCLFENELTGYIPAHLPSTLTTLDLASNFSKGEIPEQLPNKIKL
eukprot:UN00686